MVTVSNCVSFAVCVLGGVGGIGRAYIGLIPSGGRSRVDAVVSTSLLFVSVIVSVA